MGFLDRWDQRNQRELERVNAEFDGAVHETGPDEPDGGVLAGFALSAVLAAIPAPVVAVAAVAVVAVGVSRRVRRRSQP